jgi:ABC-type Mn2+/Zn2+ transport system permease subunit
MEGALAWLAEPWQEPLVRRALLEVVLLAVAGGAVGAWVVLYGLSFGAESLAHGLLPGLVAATQLSLPLLAGAGAGILLAAAAVALVGRLHGVGGDTAVAVVVTTMFGAGALLALAPETPAGLGDLLFGDPLGVADADLAAAAALVAVVGLALWRLHGPLLAVGFDRAGAPALGVRPLAVDLALLALLGLVLLVAVRGLGNLLVVAVVVAPAATARLFARRMPALLGLSVAVGVLGAVAGLYLSFHAGTAAAASVAGTLVAAHLLALPLAAAVRGAAPRAARAPAGAG